MSRITGSDALGLMEAYAAVYAPQEEIVEEVDIAAQYFYDLGLNEDGVEIVIEELGEDEFSEWVYEIAEEYVLTEEETRLQKGASLKGPKGSKPQSTTKARVKAQGGVEMKTSARPGSTVRPGKRTAAVEKAKESQPQKKGGLGAIADRVRKGMERHNKAVSDTKKTIGKAAKGVGHVAREFGKGVTGAAKFAGAVAREVTKEEVEEWVNSLIDEGYDLSEYTWEDMYEAYISEAPMTPLAAGGGEAQVQKMQKKFGGLTPERAREMVSKQGQTNIKQAASKFKPKNAFEAGGGKAGVEKMQKKFGGLTPERAKSMVTQQGQKLMPKAPTSGDYKSRFARPANAAPGISDIRGGKGPVSSTRTQNITSTSTSSSSAPRTAAAPKPTAAQASRPAAAPKLTSTKPAIGTLGKTSFERRTPTSTELKAAQAARASGASAEKALQAAKAAGSSTVKPATPTQAVAAAPKTSAAASGSVTAPTANIAAKTTQPTVAPNRATGSKKPGSTFEQYDAYDVLLEYLFSQGHVETLEEALYVMMEMDSETIQSICGTYH